MVQLSIAQHPIRLVAQILTDDTRDFVNMGQQVIQRAVLLNPLDSCLLTDFVDAYKVVARLSNQCCDFWILMGLNPVALDHCSWGIALELSDSAGARIQDGHSLID